MNLAGEQFFDGRRLRSRQMRAQHGGGIDSSFMADLVAEEFAARLTAVNRRFEHVLDFGSVWRRFPSVLGQVLPVAAIEQVSIGAEWDSYGAKQERFDLALSAFGLHWAKDARTTLAAIRSALKPDGLLLAVMPGRGTLEELRISLLAAESAASGGAAMRVDIFPDISQAGALLQGAGFALPVADMERLKLRYSTVMQLVADMRKLGASSARRSVEPLPRNIFDHLEREYGQTFADDDGRLRVSVNLIFLTGWSPHESQQKPLTPGTAQTSLAKVLGRSERK
jgi:SAM-dependent methyltransferase